MEQLPVCCLKQGPAPRMCLLFRAAPLTLYERSSLSCVLVSKVSDELFLTIIVIFLLTTAAPTGAIVGGIVAALVVIAIVVVGVIVYRRRRSRK